MGSGWTIMSFDWSRWDAIFGGGFPGAEQKILDEVLWDTDGYFDDDGVRPAPKREQLQASNEGAARCVPGARQIAFPNLVHDAPSHDPAAFTATLFEFLSKR